MLGVCFRDIDRLPLLPGKLALVERGADFTCDRKERHKAEYTGRLS
jgi:hypothetical protein